MNNIYSKFNPFMAKRFGATCVPVACALPGPGYCFPSLRVAATASVCSRLQKVAILLCPVADTGFEKGGGALTQHFQINGSYIKTS